MNLKPLFLTAALVACGSVASAQTANDPPRTPPTRPAGPTLQAAEVLRRWPAAEATQGVAVDGRHFYAVANFRIGKYDKRTGAKVAEWQGDRFDFPHINHCIVLQRQLVCANSNYPQLPMTSSIEIFDPRRMQHVKTISLGPMIGSLTWIDRRDGYWWAAFANYDVNGAEPARDHRFTTFVKFDDDWRRVEAWAFPASVLARFQPASSSGGGWGDDGLLYVTGHDHTELYVLRLPKAGSVLEHVATIPVQVEGQAIVWDRNEDRTLYGISRPKREVVVMRVPPVPSAPYERR